MINRIKTSDNTIHGFSIPYGICSTASATVSKIVTIDGVTLTEGTVIAVKFTNANSVANPTLNVNGLGAKNIYQYGTTTSGSSSSTSSWQSGAIVLLTYDGNGWLLNKGFNTDTTYSVATTSENGLLSASDKTKLDGIATGATKITVDSSLSSTSTNPVQNKVINTALDGKASTSVATTSANGLMSSSDKTKLNNIESGANNYIHPNGLAPSTTSGLYKFSTDSTSHINGVTLVTKSDITELGIPSLDTTYSTFIKSGSTASTGLVPKPPTTSGTTKYLREDATWTTPANTTYTFANGTNGFTVTPSEGSATTVTVTPSIESNITGTGTRTSGYYFLYLV